MRPHSPRPAAVRTAVAAALGLALLILAGEVAWLAAAARAADPEFGLMVFWPYWLLISALALAPPAALVHGARRLLRGDPAVLQAIGIAIGAACTAWTVLVLAFQVQGGGPVDIGSLAITGAVAVAFFGLAWLPSRGDGRAWLEAHRPRRS